MKTQKQAFGDLGEEAAVRYLVREGYHLIARNWRAGRNEVDIIAEQHGLLVFVEVKTRRNEHYAEAAEAVSHDKQANLLEAARDYFLITGADNPVRFDIVTVVGTAPPYRITHIPDAFSADSFYHVEHH